jgi:hypothetical protein
MEQYIHTLIPVDSTYCPEPVQTGAFFDWLLRQRSFTLLTERRWQPGLLVMKPTGRSRVVARLATGEERMGPEFERAKPESSKEIPRLIEGALHYTAYASGKWLSDNLPITLFGMDGEPFRGDYLCNVSCQLRPSPVSTSAWDLEAGPNTRNVPLFGSKHCGSTDGVGIFPNPWTGEPVEVPHAGCARFWVEFEFGKFIYPHIDKNFNILSPVIVGEVEQCFQTEFVQGCHFF